MAAPNIAKLSSITGKSGGAALTTTLTTALLTNAAASGLVYKLNSVYVANVDATNPTDFTISINKGTTYRLAPALTISAKQTVVVVDKNSPIYLEEGDILQGGASNASRAEVVFSYEIIS